MCHFTPPNRRVQRKPRETKETQRLLQARLEKAESLLRQAGLTGYGPQTSPNSTALNMGLEPEAASVSQEPSLNHAMMDSLAGESNMLADPQPENGCMPAQSSFEHHFEPAKNSIRTAPDPGDPRTSPRANDSEHEAMAVSYTNIAQRLVVSPNAIELRSSIAPGASSGPADPNQGTDVLQLPSPAFTVNGTDAAVCSRRLI